MTNAIIDQPKTSLPPSHTAYHVRNGKDGKAFWTKIGCAWLHADGKGFNIHLDTMPIDGKITLRAKSTNETGTGLQRSLKGGA